MFFITNHNNVQVSYIGSIKNRLIRPEDFVQLEKEEEFKSIVNINEVYEIKKGDKYTIQYTTYNPSSYDPEDETMIKMESNKVEIYY
jgi:hypothetical protein